MQIETLRYFVELARAGSFYGAAKNMFISQQGLNKAVSALEAELGVKLVERSGRGVRLTSAGDVFLGHASTLLRDYGTMLGDLYAHQRSTSEGDTRLVIHVTYYPAQISRPFLEQLNALDSVNVVEEPFQILAEGAAKSDGSELYLCDLFNPERQRKANSQLVFEPMVASRSGVVWREGSRLAGHAVVHRDLLSDQPLSVDSHREMLRLLEHVMEGRPLNNIRFGVANPRARIEYARSAGDVVLLFDSFGFMIACESPALETDGLHFTPFSTPRSVEQIGFLYNKQARPNVRARHAIETLRQHLRTRYADYFAEYPI